jgi:HK97 family phage major capsid protein
MEYRQAFMNYVQRGVAIPQKLVDKCNEFRNALPAEQRSGVAITTADTGAAIPLTIMREVINTVRKRYGNLYNAVRKTSIPGGVEYPIGALQASFKWISEDTVSPRQKTDALGKIQFAYHTGEIRVAQTFLANLLTITDFETKVIELIAVAYVQSLDTAIVKGTGSGQPLGILNDARVTNVVTLTAADMSNWQAWRKKFFAKLPLGYRDGQFIFALSTVESYLETMADANNNPVFRQATGLEVNDGDARDPNGRFFGRRISLVEPDILPDFDTASANDVIGIFWQPEEYAINENFGFTMRRYFDEETNEWVDKALVVVDGKILNPTGFWLIKKGS